MEHITRVINWLTAAGDPITATSRSAKVGGVLVIGAALILSYTALFDLFKSLGLFHWTLAAFFPLLFDLAEVTAAVIVFNAKLQGEDNRLAWRAVLLFTGLGIAANIAHAALAYSRSEIDLFQAILAAILTALFPISIALVTHLLKSTITLDLDQGSAIQTLKSLTEAITQVRAEREQIDQDIGLKQGYLADLSSQIEQSGDELEQLRLSITTLRSEHRSAQRGEFAASESERQAYQLDGALAAGMTLTAACELVGISPNTARKRLAGLNGTSISKWVQ